MLFSSIQLNLEGTIKATLTQQLLSQSSYFFRTAAYLRSAFFKIITFPQLLFQNNFFFRVNLLQSSHFLRTEVLQGSYFSKELYFWRRNCLKKTYLQKSYFFKAGISAQHQLFQESYVLAKANNSEKQYSVLHTFSVELSFQSGHFFKRRYLLQQLPFQKSYFFTRCFFRRVNISQLRFLSTAALLIYLLVIK